MAKSRTPRTAARKAGKARPARKTAKARKTARKTTTARAQRATKRRRATAPKGRAKARAKTTRRTAKAVKRATRPTAKAAKKALRKASRKAPVRAAARRSSRAAAGKTAAKKTATAVRTATMRKTPAKSLPTRAARPAPAAVAPPVAAKPATTGAATAVRRAPVQTARRPLLDRERRRLPEAAVVPSPPSSLDLNQRASAARSGQREIEEHLSEHNETGPVLTAGDVDANWESAYSTGDEAPGGDNPTPDQDIVDEIGRSLGLEYRDNEELKGADKIEARDRKRWELDPASSEDYEDRD